MYANDFGFGAYQGEASQINNNIQNWRADVDSVKGVNKQIRQEYQQKVDLDSIRNFTSELGAKGVKDVVEKYGSKLYRYKNPWTDRSIRDWDIDKTQEFKDYVKDKTGKLSSRTPDEEGIELQDLGGKTEMKAGEGVDTSVLEKDGSKVSEKLGAEDNIPETEAGEEGESLLDYFRRISKEPLGDEAEQEQQFIRDTQTLQRPNEAEAKSSQVEPQEEKYADEADDINAGENLYNENVERAKQYNEKIEEGDTPEEAGEGVKEGEGGGENIIEDIPEKIGEDAGEEGLSAGLETAGGALDATGVGAVIGVPLQIAGAIIDGGLLYEAGKSIYDWFDEDILGHKPQVPQNELLQTPTRPMTLAEKGYGVIPNRDTIDSQVSYSSGW